MTLLIAGASMAFAVHQWRYGHHLNSDRLHYFRMPYGGRCRRKHKEQLSAPGFWLAVSCHRIRSSLRCGCTRRWPRLCTIFFIEPGHGALGQTRKRTLQRANDDFDAERKSLGVTGHAVFQSVDDPNDVTVWHDFPTPRSAKDFASSSRLKEVMGKAGVKGAPQIWFVNQAN